MYRFWRFFLDKNNFTYLLTVGLLLAGLTALISIPKESAPEVRIPIAVVTTALPGASADDVEQLVTIPIEDQLASGLTEVKDITSTSREGVSVVVAEFMPSANLDDSVQEAKDEVDKVNDLPDDATDPVVAEVNFVDQPIVEFSISSDLPSIELLSLAEFVQDDIERIPGVSEVSKNGIASREVQVIARRESLQRFNITLPELVASIQQANQSIPIGGLTVSGVQYALKFEGDIVDPTVVRDIPITSRGGVPVYVRDVAFVSDGLGATESLSRLSLDGELPEQAVSFSVFKQTGADVTRVAQAVVDRVEELKDVELKDSNTFVLFNTGDDVRDDLRQLSSSGFQTVLLVVLVLLLALGTREAVLAGLAIPMSFLIAFIGLNGSGNTINFVSLFSLILAVGILVDSAIVITEGIYTNLRAGMKPAKATKAAIKELHWPIVAGTMTTIAVFFPLFFISGVTGKFIASIPFTIIFVLLASLFVALALLPVFGQRFLKVKQIELSRFAQKRERITVQLQEWYRTQLNRIVGNRKRERRFQRGIVALLIVSLLLPAFGVVKTIFFPGEDIEYLFINLENKQGTVLAITDAEVREAEAVLLQRDDVEAFITTVGSLSAFTDGDSGSSKANISVTLKDKRDKSSQVIADEVRSDMEAVLIDTEVRIEELSSGPPVGAPISVTYLGENTEDLASAAAATVSLLNDIPGVRDVETSLEDDGLDFVFRIDREQTIAAGLDVASVAGYLRTAIYGVTATTIRVGSDDIDVRVRLGLNDRAIDLRNNVESTVNAISNLIITNRAGGQVLLGSVLDVEVAAANAKIERKNQQRRIDVSADLEDGFNVQEVVSELRRSIREDIEVPAGVTVDFGGENEETNQSFVDMGFALIYGVLLIVAVLVIQFNSFRQAFIVISILPFILIGIFMGLALSGQAVSFPSIMGFIAVAGIAVNNSIILIDVMNKLHKRQPHLSPKEVAIEGGVQRLRPILLTTLTTVVGVVPLTYASAIWAPLAWSIIFGLSFAVVLTLILVPVLYRKRLIKMEAKKQKTPTTHDHTIAAM